jgi:hypothetical protein
LQEAQVMTVPSAPPVTLSFLSVVISFLTSHGFNEGLCAMSLD